MDGYHADGLLGLDGGLSPRLQEHLCRLGSDFSFAKAREHVLAFLGVGLATETIRDCNQRQAGRIAGWQVKETGSAQVFGQASGRWELAIDAGKVNTREQGWRDLKIAVAQKRPAAEPAKPTEWLTRELPEATARVMWADIAPVKQFRRGWRPRLRRLGLGPMARLHVLGDGASWIWKAADRTLTGCRQTLDVFHACEHIAGAGQKLFGEGTPEAQAFYERGRDWLLAAGWSGICRLVGETLEQGDGDDAKRREALDRLTRYFAAHLQRLDYRARLAAGDAIGSGVVEGAAKTLGLRLKARGARWKHRNARLMAAMVCVRETGQWTDFWRRAG